MDLLPAEIIDAISHYLDMLALVRLSRTCWRIYAIAREQIEKVTIPRSQTLDEIRKIEYEVYTCDTPDYYDENKKVKVKEYRGIREINGRLIGSIYRVVYRIRYTTDDMFAPTIGIDTLTIFSNKLKMTVTEYDDDGSNDYSGYCDRYYEIYCQDELEYSSSVTVSFTTRDLDDNDLTRDNIAHDSAIEFTYANTGKCNNVCICSNSPEKNIDRDKSDE